MCPDTHFISGWYSPPHCSNECDCEFAANFGPYLEEVLMIRGIPAAINAAISCDFTVYMFDFLLDPPAASVLIFL